jgi:Flp pilus assembly protein TadD
VAPIIPICRHGRLGAITGFALLSLAFGNVKAASANAGYDRNMEQYVSARLAQIENRNGEALKGYSRLFNEASDSPEIADRLFENAIIEGDMQNALRAVRAMELRNESDAAAPLLQFSVAFENSQWTNAEAAIAQLDAKSNYGFTAPILSAWVNIARGKPSGFEARPTQTSALLNYYSSDQLVYFELASGQLAKAKLMLSAFDTVDADFARDLSIRAAPLFAESGDDQFAHSLLRNRVDADFVDEALASRRKFTAAQGIGALFTRLANALIDQESAEQGLILSRMASWIDPASDPAKLALSRALYEQGYTVKSEAALEMISPSSPYWMRTSNDRVKRLATDGKVDEALKLAEQVYARRSQSTNALLLLGQMQEQAGQFSTAANSYGKLVESVDAASNSPRRKALYLLFLATALDKSGDWSAAKLKLQEGKALDPNNAYILNYLGFGMLERGEELDKALKFIKNAYLLAPDSAAIADSLGWAYFLNEDYPNAISYLEKAAFKLTNDVTINEHLGDAYWQSGHRVSARYAWRKAAYQTDDLDAEHRLQQKIDIGLPIAAASPRK